MQRKPWTKFNIHQNSNKTLTKSPSYSKVYYYDSTVKTVKPSPNKKGNQSSIFIGRNDAEAPILQPPDAKSQLIGKDPDAGKD